MEERQPTRRRNSQRPSDNGAMIKILAGLFAVMVIVMVLSLIPAKDNGGPSLDSTGSTEGTTGNTNDTTPPSEILATASLGFTGDILPHGPVIQAAKAASGSTSQYDFRSMFTYIAPYYQRFDLMIANLETTLGGTAAGEYMGWPKFNCPDDIVDALLEAGVDIMLTGNNHSYDTGYSGMLRTQQVMAEKGMDHLGTVQNAGDKIYTVKEINGIKIGIVSYTYNTGVDANGKLQLNGQHDLSAEASKRISTFNYSTLDSFYAELKQVLADMEADGAEATVVCIHWGEEEELPPNDRQKQIAQALCNMGVDVIAGGHPHVIQPLEKLTAESGHTTYCLYSTGNALSNQRRDTLTSENAKYTEDGIIFGVEFQKLSDGTVKVGKVSLMPTWVNKETRGDHNIYAIIPLDTAVESWNNYDVTDTARLYESYNRTLSLVGQGLNAILKEMGLEEVPLTVGIN